MSVIESASTTQEVRALCIQLMFRMGKVRASCEDLLRAANY